MTWKRRNRNKSLRNKINDIIFLTNESEYHIYVVFICHCLKHWRRNWHPTPVLLPGKSHGQRSLVGYSPCGREELYMTERLHFHFSLSWLEKGMATHSIVLAWRIPGTWEPGGLLSMGSNRVGHDWSDLAAAAAVWSMIQPFYLKCQ